MHSKEQYRGLQEWLQQHRNDRIVRNSKWSIAAWVIMYGVFNLLVIRWDMNTQHAKLMMTPLGVPFCCAIQWLVFRDRLVLVPASGRFWLWAKAQQVWHTFWQAVRRIGRRWWMVKAVSFGVNQYAYAMMLHSVGLPYWLAYPAAASVLSLIYYKMNNSWVFVDRWWEGPVAGRVCCTFNRLWLYWAIGPAREIALA